MSESWQESKELFQRALDVLPDQREAFVKQTASSNVVVKEVLQLLSNHSDLDSEFLSPMFPNTTVDPLIGTKIKDYEIFSRIGRGGYGSVYKARQRNPDRWVAIKVLRDDFYVNVKQRRRFAFESEALASLRHPGIAHVYQRGELDSGSMQRPWFAMELIDGENLMNYVNLRQPTRTQKLKLFVQICEAVQHAHQRQIVHRDLKPGNILVVPTESHPGECQPKLVDFGIAKSLASNGTGSGTEVTREVIGTLDYLSPEQFNRELDQLDFRTDIYSLGVLLFELLTGKLPHDRRSDTLAAVVASVQSGKRYSLNEYLPAAPKDLDAIVGKAMAQRPDNRYLTVQHLIEDIQRFIRHEPVLARPPSMVLSLQRFVQRNAMLVSIVISAFLMLSIALGLYVRKSRIAIQEAQKARYEADKAVTVGSFMTNDFLTQILANAENGKELGPSQIAQMVEQSTDTIKTRFDHQPKIQAAIFNELGTVLYNIREFEFAARQYRLAQELWSEQLGKEHPDTLKALSNLAQTQMVLDHSSNVTLKLCRDAFESRRSVLGLQDAATLHSLNNLAELLRKRGEIEEAESLFRTGLQTIEQNMKPADVNYLAMASNLGTLLLEKGNSLEAEQLHQRVYRHSRKILGDKHGLTLRAGVRWAQTLDRNQKYEDAWQELKPILLIYDNQKGREPSERVIPFRLAARVQRHLGNRRVAKGILLELRQQIEEGPKPNQSTLERIDRDLARLDRLK